MNCQNIQRFGCNSLIDNKDLYHIGASLKDLGKQCFAFDKMDDERKDIAQILNEVKASNELIKKSVENADVNEAYIYDILDKWAESRHIKIKK